MCKPRSVAMMHMYVVSGPSGRWLLSLLLLMLSLLTDVGGDFVVLTLSLDAALSLSHFLCELYFAWMDVCFCCFDIFVFQQGHIVRLVFCYVILEY